MKRARSLPLLFAFCVISTVVCFGQKLPQEARPQALSLDLGGGIMMDFVLIPAGSFLMGGDENSGDGDEYPAHKVIFSRPFYLGKYEVTQEQWSLLMGKNPSQFKGPKLPVETVSWNDCQIFLSRLAEKTGRHAVLPTEAQWEYACRAGTSSSWFHGVSDRLAADYAWYGENSENKTHPVGLKKPNPWGLYDMTGNVWEWCADFYQKHAYTKGEAIDPTGPAKGEARITRGGAWGDNTELLRSSARNCAGPEIANQGLGLRCAILLPD
ncbi:MAG: formylglycine-generating enzyme family protein [Nibricoccus sp.]